MTTAIQTADAVRPRRGGLAAHVAQGLSDLRAGAAGGEGVPTAFLFPGQGSQAPDMRGHVERWCPGLVERVTEVVGDDPFARLDEGTRFLQPAIFCASLAGWRQLVDLGVVASGPVVGVAGHSLGELAALVAAGSIDADAGVELVALRARLMDEAGSADEDGGMLAILGGTTEAVAAMAAAHGVTVANDNAPGQIVLSGAGAGLDRAKAEARAAGLRAIRLPIRGAFHSPAMAPAVDEFLAAARAVQPAEPAVPVFSCVTARSFDDVAGRLAEGLVCGVRWRETLHALHREGAQRFVEVGPGKVLTGLVRRTLQDVESFTLAELEVTHV